MLNSLNKAQQEAVMHGGRALLVLATPGSGKTFTMTQRIIRLIEQDNISPHKIQVLTFTKAAAGNMQKRFLEACEASEKTYSVNFGTFHSLSYQILKESGDLNQCKILTETEKKNLIIPVINEFISQKDEIKSRQEYVSDDATTILNAISYYKNTEDMKKSVIQLPQEWQKSFSLVFENYEKERRRQHFIDYDDMLFECYSLLKRKRNVKEHWQQRFEHILIDEFQDINPIQYKIISLLAEKKCSVFAVGDDDQSIYGFRGADPACVRLFLEDFKAESIFLGVNYRSRKEIIKASNLVIKENKNRFDKEHLSQPEKNAEHYNSQEVVCIHAFEERKEQYDYLISKVRNLEQGKSVAILFRTNSYMQSLAVRLSREGIAYTMKEKGRSIYDHFIVKDITAYFMVANGKGGRNVLLQIINKPNRNIHREALADIVTKSELSHDADKIIKLQKQMENLNGMPLYLGIKYICKVMKYEVYIREKAGGDRLKLEEWLEILYWLSEDVKRYKCLAEWMEARKEYENTNSRNVCTETQAGQRDSRLYLMTVHAAKGLEFDCVYIPDCNEKIFPYGSIVEDKACEEERRIFYVAMTRAKENLELLYLTGTKERPRLPSRFLNPLWKDYSSTNSSNSQLSKYSSNASATFSYSSSSAMYSNSGSSLGSSGFSE